MLAWLTGGTLGCHSLGVSSSETPCQPMTCAALEIPAPQQQPVDQDFCSQQEQVGTSHVRSVPLSGREVFREDRRDLLPMLARDANSLLNWQDLTILGAALGGSIAIRQDTDDEVREYVYEHPERWGNATHTLGVLGDVKYQVPVLLGVYGYSLHSEDEELHALSKAMISAFTITGLTTLTVKVIADTDRPSREWNDGRFGFPSYHVGSSFAIAAVLEEYQGFQNALPVYALAGLIGWSRIDERDHDLSDVVFGSALGYVIGKAVARQHRKEESAFRLVPYSHPTDPATGLAAEWRY